MIDHKKTGIWIDRKFAIIVSFINGDKTVDTVESGIESHERFEGETDQQGRFGGQFLSDERSREHRMEKEIHDYLEDVIKHLADSDALIIFGPADMKTRLVKSIEKYPELKGRVRAVKTVDSMTKNQVVALVRTHFNL
jgi:stalled ribosome rescue protein Dom34